MVSTISDLDIQAFVDGELGPEAADRVRDAMSRDAGLRRRHDDLLCQKKLIADAFKDLRILH